MKKALIHDWFSTYAGAEKCVESFTNVWDDFEIYGLIDFLSERDRDKILKGKRAHTSFIGKLPFAKSKYRNYLHISTRRSATRGICIISTCAKAGWIAV